jgi:hypothetical protein
LADPLGSAEVPADGPPDAPALAAALVGAGAYVQPALAVVQAPTSAADRMATTRSRA